jgi:DHA2 family multidrug resistance protein
MATSVSSSSPVPGGQGVNAARETQGQEKPQNKWLVSLAVIFGVLMSAIDTSVVNVALPNIQGNVGATQSEIAWISTGYLISVVILMPLTNWLSVRFGRKNVYLSSLVVFTASSFMCGCSRTLGGLIFWRVIQGMGAGTLQPLAQAMFREAFPPEEQGLAMASSALSCFPARRLARRLGDGLLTRLAGPGYFLSISRLALSASPLQFVY